MPGTMSSSRDSNDCYIIDISHRGSQAKNSPRNWTESDTDLITNNKHPGTSKKDKQGSQLSEKAVHLIPVVVILCFFILWWFSYPVKVEVKDGRITAIRQVEIPEGLEDTHFGVTFPELLSSTDALVTQTLPKEEEAEPPPASETLEEDPFLQIIREPTQI